MTSNVVLLITDNQSPWTLGCYGNGEILTPNVDRLAREGIHFNNAFCSNPVCSPNQACTICGVAGAARQADAFFMVQGVSTGVSCSAL